MVQSVGWFTPIHFENLQPQSRSQKLMMNASSVADGLFYWGGKVAHVTPESPLSKKKVDTILANHPFHQPFYIALLKVVAYATVIIPLIALAIKAVVRCWIHSFQIIDSGVDWGKIDMEKEFEVPQSFQEELEVAIQKITHVLSHDSVTSFLDKRNFKLSTHPQFHCKAYFTFTRAEILDEIDCPGYFTRAGINEKLDEIAQAKAFCLRNRLDAIGFSFARKITVQNNGLTDDVLVQRAFPNEVTFRAAAKANQIETSSIAQLVDFIASFPVDPRDLRVFDGKIYPLDFWVPVSVQPDLKDHLFGEGESLIAQLYYPHQFDVLFEQAALHGVPVSPQERQEIEAKRTKDIQHSWQKEKGPSSPSLVTIACGSLGLPLGETATTFGRVIRKDSGALQVQMEPEFTLHAAGRVVLVRLGDSSEVVEIQA